jgi:hypothetical protein
MVRYEVEGCCDAEAFADVCPILTVPLTDRQQQTTLAGHNKAYRYKEQRQQI